ncbi:MAG: hypothetical protein IPK58_04485 [Acidobacteria bacterium]|nr:hypothetical protein [Acidobacteriota bacterium]
MQDNDHEFQAQPNPQNRQNPFFSSRSASPEKQWIASVLICTLLSPMFAATSLGATRADTPA